MVGASASPRGSSSTVGDCDEVGIRQEGTKNKTKTKTKTRWHKYHYTAFTQGLAALFRTFFSLGGLRVCACRACRVCRVCRVCVLCVCCVWCVVCVQCVLCVLCCVCCVCCVCCLCCVCCVCVVSVLCVVCVVSVVCVLCVLCACFCGSQHCLPGDSIAAMQATRIQTSKASASSRGPAVFASSQDHMLGHSEAKDDPILRRYSVRSKLGQGTFGKVYRGFRKSSRTPVAMKFVNLGADVDKANREVQLLTSLRHPSIIPLLEYFEPKPSCGRKEAVLVFPEREGDLHRFIQRLRAERFNGDVPARALLAHSTIELWVHQLASGLAHLHAQSVIHRDLKPSNILLVWAGAGMRVELADLGTARDMTPADKKRRVFTKSAVDLSLRPLTCQVVGSTPHVGTEQYASPEAWFGGVTDSANKYGYPMDVWSLGAVLFELLTFDMFTPGADDVAMVCSAVCRLDGHADLDRRTLGPRQHVLLKAASEALRVAIRVDVRTLPSLEAFTASAPPRGLWDVAASALKWLPVHAT